MKRAAHERGEGGGMSDLAARIRRLEDIEEIRRLKHYYYARCVDRMVCLNDEAAIAETVSRFADDIVIDFTGVPVLHGKTAAAKFYREDVPRSLSWCQHRVMNEIIEVDGDIARGEWYFDCPACFRRGGGSGFSGAGLVAGRYKEEYVRQDGVWKWKRIEAQIDVVRRMRNAYKHAKFVARNR
jgi:hypothetical protein